MTPCPSDLRALPDERLRVALRGAEYFAAEAALDLENGDLEELSRRMSDFWRIATQALKAFEELPPPMWPNAETREAFGHSAAEWRKCEGARAPA